MSLGNKNTYGNKGNNFSFELRNLLLLGEINNALAAALPAPPGGLATETTLASVLAALEAGRDFEARLVEDSDTPPVVWLEVREWDVTTGSMGAPRYYLPGSTTPGAPTGTVKYVNQQTLLNQILAELQAQTTRLVSLDGKDFSTETTLAALNAKLNSLGQKASADSAPVVLSTEQQVILDAIKTAVESIDADLGTGGLNLEATQLLVKGVLDTIKTDTALINSNVVLGNLTLNTIDAVLDAIKLDTANLDVALSTRASELTLLATNALLTTMDNVLDAIAADVSTLATPVTGLATSLTNAVAAGSVAAGKRRVSFHNESSTINATVAGGTLKPGKVVTFSADGLRDVLGAIAYDPGVGGELLISTVG